MSRKNYDMFQGVFYTPTTTPKDVVPIPFKEEQPFEQFHHTTAQVIWRRQIMRKIMKQRDEIRFTYGMGWSYGTKSKYGKYWKALDAARDIERKGLHWKPEKPQLEQRTAADERRSLALMELQKTEINAAQNTVYITGTAFTQMEVDETHGVIVATQHGASGAFAAAPWGQWSNEAAP
jgi:hypothetical protein